MFQLELKNQERTPRMNGIWSSDNKKWISADYKTSLLQKAHTVTHAYLL